MFRDTPGIARLREETGGGRRFAAAGWTLVPNVSEALGLEDARGHFLLDAHYRRFWPAADPNAFGTYGTYLVLDPLSLDPSAPVLDLLGVRSWPLRRARQPVGPEVEAHDAAPLHSPGRPCVPGAGSALPSARIYDGHDLAIFARPRALPRFRLEGPGTLSTLALEPERFAVEIDAPEPSLLAPPRKSSRPTGGCFSTAGRSGSVGTACSSGSRFRPGGIGSRGASCAARRGRRLGLGLLALAAIMIAA